MKIKVSLVLAILAFIPFNPLLTAELKFASFFSDHMVLQRDKSVTVSLN